MKKLLLILLFIPLFGLSQDKVKFISCIILMFVCLFYTTSRTSDQNLDMYWYNKSKSIENWVYLEYAGRGARVEYKVDTNLYCATRLNYYDTPSFDPTGNDIHYDILKEVSNRSSDAVINGEFPIGETIYTKLCVFYMIERGAPFPGGWWSVPPGKGSNHYLLMEQMISNQ